MCHHLQAILPIHHPMSRQGIRQFHQTIRHRLQVTHPDHHATRQTHQTICHILQVTHLIHLPMYRQAIRQFHQTMRQGPRATRLIRPICRQAIRHHTMRKCLQDIRPLRHPTRHRQATRHPMRHCRQAILQLPQSICQGYQKV